MSDRRANCAGCKYETSSDTMEPCGTCVAYDHFTPKQPAPLPNDYAKTQSTGDALAQPTVQNVTQDNGNELYLSGEVARLRRELKTAQDAITKVWHQTG